MACTAFTRTQPSVAATNVEELLALARSAAGPAQLRFVGQSSNQLACEMLKVMGRVDFVHASAFRFATIGHSSPLKHATALGIEASPPRIS
jgi:hypothetical protein